MLFSMLKVRLGQHLSLWLCLSSCCKAMRPGTHCGVYACNACSMLTCCLVLDGSRSHAHVANIALPRSFRPLWSLSLVLTSWCDLRQPSTGQLMSHGWTAALSQPSNCSAHRSCSPFSSGKMSGGQCIPGFLRAYVVLCVHTEFSIAHPFL